MVSTHEMVSFSGSISRISDRFDSMTIEETIHSFALPFPISYCESTSRTKRDARTHACVRAYVLAVKLMRQLTPS